MNTREEMEETVERLFSAIKNKKLNLESRMATIIECVGDIHKARAAALQNNSNDDLSSLPSISTVMDKDGYTPLILAASQGEYEIVDFLLEEKADPDFNTINGTALDYAIYLYRDQIDIFHRLGEELALICSEMKKGDKSDLIELEKQRNANLLFLKKISTIMVRLIESGAKKVKNADQNESLMACLSLQTFNMDTAKILFPRELITGDDASLYEKKLAMLNKACLAVLPLLMSLDKYGKIPTVITNLINDYTHHNSFLNNLLKPKRENTELFKKKKFKVNYFLKELKDFIARLETSDPVKKATIIREIDEALQIKPQKPQKPQCSLM